MEGMKEMRFSKKKSRDLLALLLALVIALTTMPTTAAALAIPPATAGSDVPGLAGVAAAGKDMTATGILALKDVFAGKFLVGTTMETSAHKLYHYNAMTPENNTKPQSIWPNPSGSPSTSYRTTVTSVNNNGIYAIGHALAWHNQSNRWPDRSADRPTWNAASGLFTPLTFYWSYNNADTSLSANAQLERYIRTMATVFVPGQTFGFDAWDVVNEMMRDNPEHPEDWRNALRRGDMPMMRPSNWYGSYAQGGNGYDYVYDAYRWARQYFPDTTLNINDFNDEELPNKAVAIAELVKELNARYAKEHPEDPRMLIEMIGIQGHYNTRMDLNNLEENFRIYIETGCQIEITELDVSIPKPSGSTPTTAQLQEQARFYARLFRLLNKYADYIHRVSWWGAADNANWRSGFHPMLFSTTSGNMVGGVSRGTPKEAYWATIYPELYLGIPVEPPTLKSFNFGGDQIDVGIIPKYDVSVPKDISKIEFGAGNLVFSEGVNVENMDISVSLSNGGAVSAGQPCVATVKLRWKDSPNNADNTTTYEISFGHMSAEWIKDWNYSDTGYRSAVDVRFSDGETRLILNQEFTALDSGEVVVLNSKEFAPLPKHGKGTFAVATDSKLSDEYLSTVQLSKSVLNASTGLPFDQTDAGLMGNPDYVWKLNKDPLVPGKTYIIVSSNSGLALTHEGRSSVAAAGGTTTAVQGYFGTDIVTENGIITKTFVAQNRIESPIQDHLRFWFKPLTHPNPGQYTAENGYVGFGLQSLVHGGLIEPFFIHRDVTTTYPNTIKLLSNTHITHENLDRGVWFNTPIDPVTGETTLFLYSPGETDYYYGLAGNENGFVAERIMDINNPGDLFKVKIYEYVPVDAKAPVLAITSPANGAKYVLNQPVAAEWSSRDFDSGIASTQATVELGELIDTSRFGENEFTVTVTDNSGNATTRTVKYFVEYVFDGERAPLTLSKDNNAGSVIPVKFALKDFNGNYLNSVNAKLYYAPVDSGTVGEYLEAYARGKANIDCTFRFSEEDNQYIFNMDTKGFAAGSYRLKIVLDDYQEIEIDVTITAKGSKQ
jgi:GH35 family endo-1,4-beta-xylanase